MTNMTLQRGFTAPVVHHLRPLSTYSSPSRFISNSIGRVARGNLWLRHGVGTSNSPQQGLSHSFCCASVPYLASTSMLPRSGALQLKTDCAHDTLLMVSNNGAISTLGDRDSRGKNRFHNPSSFASSQLVVPGGVVPAYLDLDTTQCVPGDICAYP